MGHEAHECKTALQRSQPGSRAGGRGVVPGESDPSSASCMRDVKKDLSSAKTQDYSSRVTMVPHLMG